MKDGQWKPHPEFPDNESMTLYKCFDSTLFEEEDTFEKDVSLELTGDIDRAGVEKLSKDDWAFFGLPDNKRPASSTGGETKPVPNKKPKVEKTEVEQLRAKVKGCVRQVGDWVLEAQGWPNQLTSSPAPKDIITSSVAECKEWADRMLKVVTAGQALVVQKTDAMDQMNNSMNDTEQVKEQFFEFVSVLKKLIKPAVKAKSKAKAKAKPEA